VNEKYCFDTALLNFVKGDRFEGDRNNFYQSVLLKLVAGILRVVLHNWLLALYNERQANPQVVVPYRLLFPPGAERATV
jgi:hypothetical protein